MNYIINSFLEIFAIVNVIKLLIKDNIFIQALTENKVFCVYIL